MDLITIFVDWFLHLDKHLVNVVNNYGFLAYGLLFLIIFLETGVVIAPFLPGDSLIFAAGTLASIGSLNIWGLFVLLIFAAIAGDTLNYFVGRAFGNQALNGRLGRWIKKEHIDKTRAFYEKYGAKTIVLARFVPFVRTIAPFLAGTGRMEYSKFIAYNVVGGIVWVSLFLFGGYLFGDLPFIRDNFSLVIIVIIVSTIIPIIIEWIRSRRKTKFKKD